MPIDTAALTRDVRGCIADLPVRIRHNDRELDAGMSSDNLTSLLMEGGLKDQVALSITAVREDFESLPEIRDDIEIRMQDGSWRALEVQGLPDILDPTRTDIVIVLG